jgi:serine/threonine-protein phosphatase 2A regulatory subunit B
MDGNTIMTGNYNNSFHMLDVDTNSHTQYELNYKKATVFKPIQAGKMPALQKIDYLRKTSACDFNGKKNVAAIASLNCFYIYSL